MIYIVLESYMRPFLEHYFLQHLALPSMFQRSDQKRRPSCRTSCEPLSREHYTKKTVPITTLARLQKLAPNDYMSLVRLGEVIKAQLPLG
jgi:hypothetical protein